MWNQVSSRFRTFLHGSFRTGICNYTTKKVVCEKSSTVLSGVGNVYCNAFGKHSEGGRSSCIWIFFILCDNHSCCLAKL